MSIDTAHFQEELEQVRERILKTVKLAQEFGAQTAILAGSDTTAELVEYARSHNCSKVLVGRTRAAFRWSRARGMAQRLGELAPDIDLIEVGRGVAQSLPLREPGIETEIDPRRCVKRLRFLGDGLAAGA